MAFSKDQIVKVVQAAKNLSMNAPSVLVEDFYGHQLTLTPAQLATHFPFPDPTGESAIAISHLTFAREELLRDRCVVPTFVVAPDAHSRMTICGLATYLLAKGLPPEYPADLLQRLDKCQTIRKKLVELEQGHHLEALAAAILALACQKGEATKGSGDQGVDAIGSSELIKIEEAFSNGDLGSQIIPGRNVMVIASSKASIGGDSDERKLISPAHIRELVGSWLIQRSERGMWKSMGIQMLTPLQLILVTTYRLSAASKAECWKLGIQVWSIPELIFLVCRYAPVSVFKVGSRFAFSSRAFDNWWQEKHDSRLEVLEV